jgi:integrase/recombinase XerD
MPMRLATLTGFYRYAVHVGALPHSPVTHARRPSVAMVTIALDAGVSLRDVQDAARHADPRTTRRHDRARQALDRHR